MAKNNQVNATVNAAEAAVETKEEVTMAQNSAVVENQAAPVVEQAQQPVAAPVVTTEAGTQVPATQPTEEKVGFWQKAKAGAKKWGKRVAIAGAVVGGLLIAHKVGEASGFDKATDAYNSKQSGDDPEPDYSPDDDLGDEGVKEISES